MPTNVEMEVSTAPVIVDAETYGKADPRIVSMSAPMSAASEQYRMLALRIEQFAQDGLKRIGITSAVSGEGTTVTAVNTALALGRGRRNKVALVDANLRNPGAHEVLGLSAQHGLCDVVRTDTTLGSTLWRFGGDDLWVLPAGKTSEPHVLSGSRRMGEVLEELRDRMDIVLVDCPPVMPTADMPALGRYLDGVVLAIRAGETSRELVDMALDALQGVRVLGCVLVGIEEEAGTAYKLLRQHDDRQKQLALPARR